MIQQTCILLPVHGRFVHLAVLQQMQARLVFTCLPNGLHSAQDWLCQHASICCLCPCSGQQQFVEKPKGPKLLDSVMAALRNDGSILMPVDTAGRVLEVMLLLEKHWAVNRLSYPLALLSPVAYNTLEFAKSQLEWMNEQVAREFENSRDKDNPFSMR